MKENKYKNLEGRNKLIEKLTQEYITASASEATIILGNHGSGKSHVVFEVINRIHSVSDFMSCHQIAHIS